MLGIVPHSDGGSPGTLPDENAVDTMEAQAAAGRGGVVMLRPAAARSKANQKNHVADGGGHEVSPPSEGASKKPASKDTPPVTEKIQDQR